MPTNSSTAPKRNVLASLLGLLGMSGIAGVLVAAMMTPLIAVAGVTANSTITLFESLPSYLEIQPLQQKTELYGVRGDHEEKFAEFYAQNRVEVPLDQISPYIKDAVIATEDPRFYSHGGVDVVAATRALLVSVLGDDGGGASTITMQYVRNQRVQAAEALLDPVARQKAYEQANEITMARKLQEMRLAIGVEKQYTKDEVLNGYLNIALFGGTVYGVESAAQYYFGKSAKDVTLPEGALIAGMVQNPNAFRIDDPDLIDGATDRRNYVLKRMYEEKKITKDEYDAAVATPVEPHITPTQHGCMNATGSTGFFCDYVRKVILNDPAFGSTYEERLFNFQTQGYQIHTTIDLDLQDATAASMEANIPFSMPDMNFGSAISVVQPGTGHVLAMAQNKVFDESDTAQGNPEHTSVNYNTDFQYGGSTGFQVGSTYKVFTLANWVQSGHSLNERIDARNRVFDLSKFQDSCTPGGHGGTWEPNNYLNQKYTTMNAIEATVESANTAYVAMGEKLDQCVTRDIAMALGAHRADGQENTTFPSDILGTNEVAPLSMATAVAGLANGGVSCSPIAITSITFRDGSEVDPPKSECTQAISPEVAAAVDYVMQQSMQAGYTSISDPGLGPMIGKTGTSDDSVQNWVIAATTKIAAASWVGNVEQYVTSDGVNHGYTSMEDLYINGHYGPTVRHLTMHDAMAFGVAKYGSSEFPEPNPEALRVENITVPDVRGMSMDQAIATLEAAGFSAIEGSAVNSSSPAGTAAATNPSPNTSVPKGSTVTVSPSNGRNPSPTSQPSNDPNKFAMPNLVGMTVEQAQGALDAAGFQNNGGNLLRENDPNGSGQSGIITRTNPTAGSSVDKDSQVRLYVNP